MIIDGEDGRWGTCLGRFSFASCAGDFENACDVDGSDVAKLIASPSIADLQVFAAAFSRDECR